MPCRIKLKSWPHLIPIIIDLKSTDFLERGGSWAVAGRKKGWAVWLTEAEKNTQWGCQWSICCYCEKLADPQVYSADRRGSRRLLTGWDQTATWPCTDYKQKEEGKEIRLKTDSAFLTWSPVSHWQHRRKLQSQDLHSNTPFFTFSSLHCTRCSTIHAVSSAVCRDPTTSRTQPLRKRSWGADIEVDWTALFGFCYKLVSIDEDTSPPSTNGHELKRFLDFVVVWNILFTNDHFGLERHIK